MYSTDYNELISRNFSFFHVVILFNSKSTDQYNEQLSKRRVESLQQYLIENGVNPGKIRIEWEGEKAPLNNNTTEEERAKNRRVDIRLIERF